MGKRKKGKVNSEKKQVKKINWALIISILALLISISILAFSASNYYNSISNKNKEKENLKNQIYSSFQKAASLKDARNFEEAIKEYDGILNKISYTEFPMEYGMTQNNLGSLSSV